MATEHKHTQTKLAIFDCDDTLWNIDNSKIPTLKVSSFGEIRTLDVLLNYYYQQQLQHYKKTLPFAEVLFNYYSRQHYKKTLPLAKDDQDNLVWAGNDKDYQEVCSAVDEFISKGVITPVGDQNKWKTFFQEAKKHNLKLAIATHGACKPAYEHCFKKMFSPSPLNLLNLDVVASFTPPNNGSSRPDKNQHISKICSTYHSLLPYSDVVFVDDNENNIRAAKTLGCQLIQAKTNGDHLDELAKLLNISLSQSSTRTEYVCFAGNGAPTESPTNLNTNTAPQQQPQQQPTKQSEDDVYIDVSAAFKAKQLQPKQPTPPTPVNIKTNPQQPTKQPPDYVDPPYLFVPDVGTKPTSPNTNPQQQPTKQPLDHIDPVYLLVPNAPQQQSLPQPSNQTDNPNLTSTATLQPTPPASARPTKQPKDDVYIDVSAAFKAKQLQPKQPTPPTSDIPTKQPKKNTIYLDTNAFEAEQQQPTPPTSAIPTKQPKKKDAIYLVTNAFEAEQQQPTNVHPNTNPQQQITCTSSLIYVNAAVTATSTPPLQPLSDKHKKELSALQQDDLHIYQANYDDCFPLAAMFAMIKSDSTECFKNMIKICDYGVEIKIPSGTTDKPFGELKKEAESVQNNHIPYSICKEGDNYIVTVSEAKLKNIESDKNKAQCNSLLVKVLDSVLAIFIKRKTTTANSNITVACNYNAKDRDIGSSYTDFVKNAFNISGFETADHVINNIELKSAFPNNLPVVISAPWDVSKSNLERHAIVLSQVVKKLDNATKIKYILTAINPHDTATKIDELTKNNYDQIKQVCDQKPGLQNVILINCNDRVLVCDVNGDLVATVFKKSNNANVYNNPYDPYDKIIFCNFFEKPEYQQLIQPLLDSKLLPAIEQAVSSSSNSNDNLSAKYLAILKKRLFTNGNSSSDFLLQLKNDLMDCIIEYLLSQFNFGATQENLTAQTIINKYPQLTNMVDFLFPNTDLTITINSSFNRISQKMMQQIISTGSSALIASSSSSSSNSLPPLPSPASSSNSSNINNQVSPSNTALTIQIDANDLENFKKQLKTKKETLAESRNTMLDINATLPQLGDGEKLYRELQEIIKSLKTNSKNSQPPNTDEQKNLQAKQQEIDNHEKLKEQYKLRSWAIYVNELETQLNLIDKSHPNQDKPYLFAAFENLKKYLKSIPTQQEAKQAFNDSLENIKTISSVLSSTTMCDSDKKNLLTMYHSTAEKLLTFLAKVPNNNERYQCYLQLLAVYRPNAQFFDSASSICYQFPSLIPLGLDLATTKIYLSQEIKNIIDKGIFKHFINTDDITAKMRSATTFTEQQSLATTYLHQNNGKSFFSTKLADEVVKFLKILTGVDQFDVASLKKVATDLNKWCSETENSLHTTPTNFSYRNLY